MPVSDENINMVLIKGCTLFISTALNSNSDIYKHKYHSLGINLDKMLPSPWRLAKIACTDITHDVNFLVV